MTTQDAMDIPDLRKDHDRLKRKVQAFEARELARQLAAIGLEPERGLGKAIASGFTGDLDEDGAVAAFAKEEYDYTYTPPAAVEEGAEATFEDKPVPDQRARQLADSQSRIDEVMGQSTPAGTGVIDIAAAFDEKAGKGEATRPEAVASVNAKVDSFMERFGQ